jgi:hypothetical protein
MSKSPMNLAMFLYAAEHVSRICRVLKQPGRANHVTTSRHVGVSQPIMSVLPSTSVTVSQSRQYI